MKSEQPLPARELVLPLLVAEFVGTFCIIFIGCGAMVVNATNGGAITHAGVALSFGLVVLAMIYALGDVSGAHLNPAVTLAFCAAGRFEVKRVLPYLGSQLAGAVAGSGLLKLLFPDGGLLGATLPAGALSQSLVLETVLTAILMFVVLSVSTGAKEKGITAGIAVGAVIAMEAMFAGPVSGASMNPFRSLAPALVSKHLEHVWIYLVGPVAGALLAVPLCCLIRRPDCCAAARPMRPEE